MIMKWTWDPAAGAIYLHLAEGEPGESESKLRAVDTVSLAGDDPPAEVLLDIDRGTGQLAGIEILIPDGGSTFVRLRELLKTEPEVLGG